LQQHAGARGSGRRGPEGIGLIPEGTDPAGPARPAADPAPGAPDYSLLPKDRTFAQLLPAYLLPYAAYVGIGSLPAGPLGPDAAGFARFAVVAALLWHFRKSYRFGPRLTPRQSLAACGGAIAALILWILAYRFSLALPWWRSHLDAAGAAQPSLTYWAMRSVNSALLVPLFEELFCRAYLGELLFGLAPGRGVAGGFSARLGLRMDATPMPLPAPPVVPYAVAGSALLFSFGHDPSAWLPALAYFLFTSWLYARTRSFRVCILVHALVNLAIAGLVLGRPEMKFLWF
jgi:membrane protease YdiL (CAAX protease family)